jgi:hypothetical protein
LSVHGVEVKTVTVLAEGGLDTAKHKMNILYRSRQHILHYERKSRQVLRRRWLENILVQRRLRRRLDLSRWAHLTEIWTTTGAV